ncbi:Fic family protein [Streptomyces sp. NBC_00510]
MSHALVERYGRWAVGWRWAHDEGDFDGGPVGNWCCPRDSITTPEETLARVVAALCEWRGWLESLAGWFEAYPLKAPDGVTDGPVVPARDGAAEDIRAFDGAVDATRADGLLAALEQLRADAARGASLNFELLQGWQQHVLDTAQPPPFRTLPAFAKGGRERYGIGPGTRDRLDACLTESAAGGEQPLPLTARAARAHLDVCFFHPFDDGNARSAFLALVFVLAREGVALNGVSLLRRIAFQAADPQDALMLARYIDVHRADTRRSLGALGS